jgi:hypothetical protein
MWARAPLTNRQAAWLALQLAKRLSQSAKAASWLAGAALAWAQTTHREKRAVRQAAAGIGAK